MCVFFLILANPTLTFLPESISQIQAMNNFNVILIILDAASASHFSCYGYPIITTPNIDAFSKRCLVFKNAYTSSVFTRGSGASLFTSLYQGTHKVINFNRTLPEEAKTLAEVFKENGYKTAMFTGSGNVSYFSGLNQGFADYHEFFLTRQPELITKAMLAWLTSKSAQKFFIYAHYQQPHAPLTAPEEIRKKFTPASLHKYLNHYAIIENMYNGTLVPDQEQLAYFISQYDANMYYADWGIKELLSYVLDSTLKNNTIVIITADHGEALGEHKLLGKQWFGHNRDTHRQVIWIPLLIYFPLNISKRFVPQVVENVDLMPTLIKLLNLKGAPGYMQGTPYTECFFSSNCSTKGFSLSFSSNKKYYSIIDSNYHMILDSQTGERELYDINKDREEKHTITDSNSRLADYYADKIDKLRQKNSRLRTQLYKSWAERTIKLSPEAIENLKALGYIK